MPPLFPTNQSVMVDRTCGKCGYAWASAELERMCVIYTCLRCGAAAYEDLPSTSPFQARRIKHDNFPGPDDEGPTSPRGPYRDEEYSAVQLA